MNIALKEANETEYWLMLLHDSDYLESKVFESVVEDCREIIKLLISIVKTSKKNKNN
jgi:four helix bundle protein